MNSFNFKQSSFIRTVLALGVSVAGCNGISLNNALLPVTQTPAPSPVIGGNAPVPPVNTSTPSGFKPEQMELWYYHHSYLTTNADGRVDASKALIDRAVAAGYTGLAFYDGSFQQILRDSGLDTQYQKAVIDYAASKGLKLLMPVIGMGNAGGWRGVKNDSPLGANPNFAEGPQVRGTRFTVVSGGSTGLQLQVNNSISNNEFGDGGFESGTITSGGLRTSGFSTGDGFISLDRSGCHSGSYCAHIASGSNGANQRLYHGVTLTPWRQYHLSFWLKASGVSQSGWPHIALRDVDNGSYGDRVNAPLVTDTQGQWKKFDYLFNSRESANAYLAMGVWGGINAGDIWFDDVNIEEVGLVDVLRREGTPLKMYNPSNPTVTYVESAHFKPISDPVFLAMNGVVDPFHAPPAVEIIPGPGAPALGDTVAIDYYALVPFYETLDYAPAFACLTDHGVQDFNKRVAERMSSLFPSGSGFFMGYDEMRVIGHCDACKRKGTPGAVLASNAQTMTALLTGPQGIRPGAPNYVWNDMFDKFHNAHDGYYQVDGDLANSWKGLSSDVTIMNWHPLGNTFDSPSDLSASLKFFAGVTAEQPIPHRQIISSYYDPGGDENRGCKSAQDSMAKAAGIPGVVGMMYTTWNDDYSQLENFARCARAAWDQYKATRP